MSSTAPRVSVGLPVYNGERFLRESIDSILGQTFGDLELVICDNASTDATQEICQHYVEKDPRVRYHRNETNLGAAPNFRLAAELARGVYFKWGSDDDVLCPTFIERCVAELDANPDAVLCQSLIDVIDENGETLDVHDSNLLGSRSESAAERFGCLALQPHQCIDLLGVIRRDHLMATQEYGAYPGSDRAMMCELGLRGPLLQLPEPLFRLREHPGRYRRTATTPEERMEYHDPARKGEKIVPTWRLYREYWRMLPAHLPDRGMRLRCVPYLLRWWFVNWNAARVAVDVLALVAPRALTWAERIKQRAFSPEPGPEVRRETRP